jgi:hypothetical protein
MSPPDHQRHPAKKHCGSWMLPGGRVFKRAQGCESHEMREHTWVWLYESSDHETVACEVEVDEFNRGPCARYAYQRAQRGRPEPGPREDESKSEETMTTNDPESTIKDLIGEIADDASEGLRDGAAHALAATAASKLSKLAVRHGAPKALADSQWAISLLTVLAPVLILALIRMLRDQLPKNILALEAVAHRAVRGAASSYATVVVKIATEWLGSLLEDDEAMTRRSGPDV